MSFKVRITRDEYKAWCANRSFKIFASCTFPPGDIRYPKGYIMTEWMQEGDIKPFVRYEMHGDIERYYLYCYTSILGHALTGPYKGKRYELSCAEHMEEWRKE